MDEILDAEEVRAIKAVMEIFVHCSEDAMRSRPVLAKRFSDFAISPEGHSRKEAIEVVEDCREFLERR